MATIQEALVIARQHHQAGRFALAEEIYRRILAAEPELAEVYDDLGTALKDQGRVEEAIEAYRQAVACKPDFAAAHYNLGNALRERLRFDEAITGYRRALEFDPHDADTYNNLGVALREAGQPDAALDCYQQALRLQPAHPLALSNLGTAWQDLGILNNALACFREALQRTPANRAAHDNLLYALQYRDGVTPEELLAAHQHYEALHAAPLRAAWRPPASPADPERPLRLGFISADFGRHPVGYFLIRVLEHLDRHQFPVVCYSDRQMPDEMTARFRAAAAAWRDTESLPDAALAEQIRADRIDILFDLTGHTCRNRLLVFARRPAPLQITWIGYVGTTGLAAMDYLLADRHHVPAEAERHYCERLLRMPDGYVCFDPPTDAPPVGPLPALTSGRITLGSFNQPAKFSPTLIATWSALLHALPDARLMLKYRGLESPLAAERIHRLFSAQGIDTHRILLTGGSSHADLLAAYNQIDVALDTFPYGGGLTTCESLWMGVPVVTCPHTTFASRHALSHLSTLGLTETIARDSQDYVALAAALAGDLPRLATLRRGLRERMAASPLCDGSRFTQNLMHLLRETWRRWCEEHPRHKLHR